MNSYSLSSSNGSVVVVREKPGVSLFQVGLVLKANLLDEVHLVLWVLLALLLLGLQEVSFVDFLFLDEIIDVLDGLLNVHSVLSFLESLAEGKLRVNLGHLLLFQEFHQVGKLDLDVGGWRSLLAVESWNLTEELTDQLANLSSPEVLKRDFWVANKKHLSQNLDLGDFLLDLVLHDLVKLWVNLDDICFLILVLRNEDDWAHGVLHLGFQVVVEQLV